MVTVRIVPAEKSAREYQEMLDRMRADMIERCAIPPEILDRLYQGILRNRKSRPRRG